MSLDPAFHVVGTSHHRAGLEVREQFALTPAEAAAWLEAERLAGHTGLLLSTCNRCEVYWTGDHDLEVWFREFARSRGVNPELAVTRLDGSDAVRHLFAVAAGLDSQIVGETEILGQVRRAFDAARTAGTTDRLMEIVFSAALSAGRRVRRETPLGRHPASVSSAAVDVGAAAAGGLAGKRIVVLGAGEVAQGVLGALQTHAPGPVAMVNRHRDRATALAAGSGAVVVGVWEELDALLAAADLLFVTTSSTRPLISSARLAEAVAGRPGRVLVALDLSVPRNVDPAARDVPGVRLFDLDDLQQLRCPASGFTSPGIMEAEQILAAEIGRLARSLRDRAAAPGLTELHRIAARLAEEETARACAQLGQLTEREREIIAEMAERLVRRVLYPVSRSIREQDANARREDSPQLTVSKT